MLIFIMYRIILISWEKDGVSLRLPLALSPWPLPHSSHRVVGGSLVLPSVQVPDAGRYRCTANSTAGTAAVSTTLVVTTPLTVQVRRGGGWIEVVRSSEE